MGLGMLNGSIRFLGIFCASDAQAFNLCRAALLLTVYLPCASASPLPQARCWKSRGQVFGALRQNFARSDTSHCVGNPLALL